MGTDRTTRSTLRALGALPIRVLLAWCAAAPGGLPAQDLPIPLPTPDAAPPAPSPDANAAPRGQLLVEQVRTDTRSWALFAACDANADDRLDVFEARAALVDLGSDPLESLRRIDANSDGFLQWPEFDARFQTALERAGSFRVRVVRPVREPLDPAAPGSSDDPTQLLLRATDRDGDGGISPAELRQLLESSGLDPLLIERFPALDFDSSGRLEQTEFSPLLQFLPGAWNDGGIRSQRRRALPADDRAADTDLDGVLSRAELEASLRLLHPSLARWTGGILSRADRSGDAQLGGTELVAARHAARAAAGLADR
ncbi:MAG: hypothetical protein IPM29_10730 [Planctomycetes bacterium]|nr:hypothetical protein [Planctomycetota bacterium]